MLDLQLDKGRPGQIAAWADADSAYAMSCVAWLCSGAQQQQQQGSVLLAAAAGYEGEAAVAAIAHIMRQQRLSPYAAAVAARYQHTALHVRSHFMSAWRAI